jgi:uncharacterized membrane protein
MSLIYFKINNHGLKIILLYVMAFLFVLAGINHFWHPETYLRIMPPYLPVPQMLNYASGIAEITLGIMLCFNATQKWAAWGIAIMLVLFFAVHIFMLQQSLDKAPYAVTPAMAWARLLLQPILIAWALWYTKMRG